MQLDITFGILDWSGNNAHSINECFSKAAVVSFSFHRCTLLLCHYFWK
jgi:hypothetical protein